MSIETVLSLGAEIVLIASAVLIFVGSSLFEARRASGWIALAGVATAACVLWGSDPAEVTGAVILNDGLTLYVRWLALAAGALFVLLAWRPSNAGGTPEYLGSLLLTISGAMLVAGANDLVLLFLGLELVSIPTYVLLYLGRDDSEGQEATVKYFYLSILASAMLLYGFSFLYGAAGSTDLEIIHQKLAAGAEGWGALLITGRIALVMIFAGLGFKIAAVPFHFYAPDVYQGTTHANAGLLSIVPKIAGLIALVRVVAVSMDGLEQYSWQIAMAMSVLTMTLGNVMALWQQNIRRMLAYSSIAHAGYMLIGLSAYMATDPEVAVRFDGAGALLLYLALYAAATIGTFAALSCLGRGQKQIDGVDELAGLGWTGGPVRPVLAWAIAVFMFSLAGIPPLAGFWGKLSLFAAALSVEARPVEEFARDWSVGAWFVGLAVVGALNAAIAAAYYLRVVGVMFFRLPLGTPQTREQSAGPFLATVLCLILVIVIGFSPGALINSATDASPSRTADLAGRPSELMLTHVPR